MVSADEEETLVIVPPPQVKLHEKRRGSFDKGRKKTVQNDGLIVVIGIKGHVLKIPKELVSYTKAKPNLSFCSKIGLPASSHSSVTADQTLVCNESKVNVSSVENGNGDEATENMGEVSEKSKSATPSKKSKKSKKMNKKKKVELETECSDKKRHRHKLKKAKVQKGDKVQKHRRKKEKSSKNKDKNETEKTKKKKSSKKKRKREHSDDEEGVPEKKKSKRLSEEGFGHKPKKAKKKKAKKGHKKSKSRSRSASVPGNSVDNLPFIDDEASVTGSDWEVSKCNHSGDILASHLHDKVCDRNTDKSPPDCSTIHGNGVSPDVQASLMNGRDMALSSSHVICEDSAAGSPAFEKSDRTVRIGSSVYSQIVEVAGENQQSSGLALQKKKLESQTSSSGPLRLRSFAAEILENSQECSSDKYDPLEADHDFEVKDISQSVNQSPFKQELQSSDVFCKQLQDGKSLPPVDKPEAVPVILETANVSKKGVSLDSEISESVNQPSLKQEEQELSALSANKQLQEIKLLHPVSQPKVVSDIPETTSMSIRGLSKNVTQEKLNIHRSNEVRAPQGPSNNSPLLQKPQQLVTNCTNGSGIDSVQTTIPLLPGRVPSFLEDFSSDIDIDAFEFIGPGAFGPINPRPNLEAKAAVTRFVDERIAKAANPASWEKAEEIVGKSVAAEKPDIYSPSFTNSSSEDEMSIESDLEASSVQTPTLAVPLPDEIPLPGLLDDLPPLPPESLSSVPLPAIPQIISLPPHARISLPPPRSIRPRAALERIRPPPPLPRPPLLTRLPSFPLVYSLPERELSSDAGSSSVATVADCEKEPVKIKFALKTLPSRVNKVIKYVVVEESESKECACDKDSSASGTVESEKLANFLGSDYVPSSDNNCETPVKDDQCANVCATPADVSSHGLDMNIIQSFSFDLKGSHDETLPSQEPISEAEVLPKMTKKTCEESTQNTARSRRFRSKSPRRRSRSPRRSHSRSPRRRSPRSRRLLPRRRRSPTRRSQSPRRSPRPVSPRRSPQRRSPRPASPRRSPQRRSPPRRSPRPVSPKRSPRRQRSPPRPSPSRSPRRSPRRRVSPRPSPRQPSPRKSPPHDLSARKSPRDTPLHKTSRYRSPPRRSTSRERSARPSPCYRPPRNSPRRDSPRMFADSMPTCPYRGPSPSNTIYQPIPTHYQIPVLNGSNFTEPVSAIQTITNHVSREEVVPRSRKQAIHELVLIHIEPCAIPLPDDDHGQTAEPREKAENEEMEISSISSGDFEETPAKRMSLDERLLVELNHTNANQHPDPFLSGSEWNFTQSSQEGGELIRRYMEDLEKYYASLRDYDGYVDHAPPATLVRVGNTLRVIPYQPVSASSQVNGVTSCKTPAKSALSGISVSGFGSSKRVMFADNVRPGDGTSPSCGEEMSSPPPPKKRRKRRKKTPSPPENELDDLKAELEEPPPPPLGSPPLGTPSELSGESPAATCKSPKMLGNLKSTALNAFQTPELPEIQLTSDQILQNLTIFMK